MDAAMLQLRSFVHQRLRAAAEEILGEVEKTVTLALYEAEVGRSTDEIKSLRHQLGLLRKRPAADFSWTSGTAGHTDQHGAPRLQEGPEESNVSLSSEVPGPSQTSEHLENNNWTHCLGETDFKLSDTKEEQEEVAFPSPEMVTGEQDQPEKQVSHEMHPVSSDCSAAQSEDEERRCEEMPSSRGGQNRSKQSGSGGREGPAVQPHKKSEKDCSFCHLCGKGFQYIGSLMKHIKTHESAADCTICGMRHQSTIELISHLQLCHSKTHFCNVCGKTFASNRCLQVHEKIHTGAKEFVCQECGKTFYRKEHLVVHVRIHSGEKPYHCEICGKAFSQSQNLTIHKRSHSGEKPYHCDVCCKLFNTSSQLKTHMRYHSGEKPHPCDMCGKRFRTSGQMGRHKTIHTGERPYACQICGMRYKFAPNLKVHLQSHLKGATK